MKNTKEISPLDNALLIIGKKFDLQIVDSINKNGNKARFNQITKDIPKLIRVFCLCVLKSLKKQVN
jgi:DNA-binding HxlR family transcriptional regulator